MVPLVMLVASLIGLITQRSAATNNQGSQNGFSAAFTNLQTANFQGFSQNTGNSVASGYAASGRGTASSMNGAYFNSNNRGTNAVSFSTNTAQGNLASVGGFVQAAGSSQGAMQTQNNHFGGSSTLQQQTIGFAQGGGFASAQGPGAEAINFDKSGVIHTNNMIEYYNIDESIAYGKNPQAGASGFASAQTLTFSANNQGSQNGHFSGNSQGFSQNTGNSAAFGYAETGRGTASSTNGAYFSSNNRGTDAVSYSMNIAKGNGASVGGFVQAAGSSQGAIQTQNNHFGGSSTSQQQTIGFAQGGGFASAQGSGAEAINIDKTFIIDSNHKLAYYNIDQSYTVGKNAQAGSTNKAGVVTKQISG